MVPTTATDDDVIGASRAAALQGAVVDVIVWGHVAEMTAAGPIAAHAAVMPTATGLVDDLDPDVVPRFGFALQAADQAGDTIDVLMVGGASGVGGGAVDPNYLDLTDPGTPVVGAVGDARLAYDGGEVVVSLEGAAYQALQRAPSTSPADYEFDLAANELPATLAALPLRLDADAYLRMPSGGFTSGTIAGFTGLGTIYLVGARTAATLTSGAQSGTAGAGTTSTSLVKPTGANNWTPNELVGKFLYPESGGGAGADPINAPVLAPITANTTSALAVESIPGMDSSTGFQIVTLASYPDALLTVRDCTAPVVFRGIKFSAAALSLLLNVLRANVTLEGCHLAVAGSDVTARLARGDFVVDRCYFSNSSTVSIEKPGDVVMSDCYGSGHNGVSISDFGTVDVTKYRSVSSVGRALTLLRGGYAAVEAQADSSGSTPFYFESVDVGISQGSLHLAGSNNTAGLYGLQLEGTGYWYVVGSTVTGHRGSSPVKDVLRGGVAELWSNLTGTTYGAAGGFTGLVQAHSTPAQLIARGNRNYTGSITCGGYFLTQGTLYASFGTTSARQTATGTTIDDALSMESAALRAGIIVGTTPPGTGIMLSNITTIPGAELTVLNLGANTLNVYPAKRTIGLTTYTGSIDGAAAGTPTTVAAGKSKTFRTLDTPLLNVACFDVWTVAAT